MILNSNIIYVENDEEVKIVTLIHIIYIIYLIHIIYF